MPVIALSAGAIGEQSSSCWAQGGIAAAMGDDDTPASHAEDTLKAGAGLCDPAIAGLVTKGGASVIEALTKYGVTFDRNAAGKLQLGLEAAHSHRRIVHVGGDGAGRAIIQAIVARVRATPSIEVIENARAVDLLTDDHGITGVVYAQGDIFDVLKTNHVVLATGGAGALWRHTTNPLGSWGAGLSLAARAGAELIDLEFMQFHPTAIDIGRDPMPLASEALRGEGAILINENGERFMKDLPRAELEPRDVVARAIHAEIRKGHRIFLDARQSIGGNFATRFPVIYAACLSAGIDATVAPIPVRPAAHYHMGGVKVDAMGRSSVDGLYACGEVAATGLHGANRLASNSLLEAAFFGARVAQAIAGQQTVSRETNLIEPMFDPSRGTTTANTLQVVRDIMSDHLGVLRDEDGMETAIENLLPLAPHSDMALVASLIATAALRRTESRGSHTRTDYPLLDTRAWRQTVVLQDVMGKVPDVPAQNLMAAGA